MMLLDIHSHILPCVDDGAKSLEESIELLEMLKSQGVTDVVATPHFYPHIQSAEEFLQSRQEAYNKLKDAIKDKDLPKVHIGCEMFYYDDMGKIGDIKSFTIENSPYILVELSMTDVTKRVVETIENMCDTGYIPIMAHIERYLQFRGIKGILKLISEGKCLAQVNASSIVSVKNNHKILKLIKAGYIYVLGSDAHSAKERPPFIKEALDIIECKIGHQHKNRMIINSGKLCRKIFGDDYE